ncbi:hypothetical protein STEG23_015606 [Scotinomys teguina]
MFCGFPVTSTSCLHGGLASSLPAALPWTPPLPFLVPPSGPSPNHPSLVLYLPPHVLWLPGNFYILSSWRSGVFSSCCLALDSSSSFPCPAFQAIAKSGVCMCMGAHVTQCGVEIRGQVWVSALSLHPMEPRIELRSSGLVSAPSIEDTFYTAEKNNDTMKFSGKWIELENVILSESFLTSGLNLNIWRARLLTPQAEVSAVAFKLNYDVLKYELCR